MNGTRFKVGDVVVCISSHDSGGELVLNQEYVVKGLWEWNVELANNEGVYWESSRFHLAKTNHSQHITQKEAMKFGAGDVAFHRNTARWCEHSAQQWLEKAIDIQKERGKNYDKNEERSAGKVADIFNILRDKDLTEADVFLILQILKQVRYCQHFDNPHEDSLLDNIAYASLFAEAAMRKQA